MNKVAKIKVEKNLKKAISQAVDQIGGFKKIIKKGDVVLLKPNFNTADPFPASTDIAFLKAVVEIVYQFSPKSVILGDSSTLSLNTRKIMEKIGVFDLEKMEKAPKIYVFDERPWIRKEVPNGKYLKRVYVPQYIDRADKLILLPCLKTHDLAQFTGALKLSIGLMKPFHRVALHAWHLQEKIAEMNKIINPNLVIMDARKCFINKGPAKGEIAQPNLILASKSRINIDIEGIKIIQSFKNNSLKGLDPLKITQIKKAKEFGIK